MEQRKDLFDLLLKKVKEIADKTGESMYKGFGRWFANMYFPDIIDFLISDGGGDGKVDMFVEYKKGQTIKHAVINSKFTGAYDQASPIAFYDEITRFWQAFADKSNRKDYVNNVVRSELKELFTKHFKYYDNGSVELFFITNHRINTKQHEAVKNYGLSIYHLDDILQLLIEYLEGAMPETEPLILANISSVLTVDKKETVVPTTIIFARLVDFINYMENDPLDLFFARNVRLWLGKTEPNKGIISTFNNSPKEFAYSNNGITIICKRHKYDPGKRELTIENPRVVNGSQTLHCIRGVENPSRMARVMVRIIEIPYTDSDLAKRKSIKRDIIHKISIRSNMQNPIKRWNLVSNDDFQNELARFFLSRKLFYERRQNEWRNRKLHLRNLGINRGPDLRWIMQLMAAYYYERKYFGPAVAQGGLNSLFTEDPYTVIRQTSNELIYQLYLLGEIMYYYLREWKGKRKYIAEIYRYIKFSLFSILCKTINIINQGLWGKEIFTSYLEKENKAVSRIWRQYIKRCIDHILLYYNHKRKELKKVEGRYLTYANYFKTRSYLSPLVEGQVDAEIINLAKKIYTIK